MNAEIHPGMPDFDLDDARLEKLLREDALRDAYVEDAGFTAQVMAALPVLRRQRSYSWLGPALGGMAVAGVACFSPTVVDLLAPLSTAVGGHGLPHLQNLLVFVPLIAFTYGAAWFAATDSD